MNLKVALEILSDGHTVISVKKAKEVCEFVKVPFSETLVQKYKSDPQDTFKGLTMKPEFENTEGVYTLELSRYVAEQLNIKDKARVHFGRGSQTRAYAEEIEKILTKKKKIKITGFRDENGCTIFIDGKKLIHQVKHSPTGLEWGYFGSGPADTARSILLQALQDNAEELHLLKSQAKAFAERYYQQFKFDFVGDWQKDMFETKIDITEWLKTKGAIV